MAKKIINDPMFKLAKLYHETFSSAAGVKVLHDLRSIFYDRSSHVPGDVFSTAVKVGQTEVVLYIKDMLDLVEHPEVFISAEDAEEF
jgi:hypothetical protein